MAVGRKATERNSHRDVGPAINYLYDQLWKAMGTHHLLRVHTHMMIQLDPPLPFETPKGMGWAHILVDRGQEHHLMWVVFIEKTGECWSFENPDIRMADNLTMGRPRQEYKWRSYWSPEKKENAGDQKDTDKKV